MRGGQATGSHTADTGALPVERSAAFADTLSKLTRVGTCEWDPDSQEARFSTTMYALHGLDPADPAPPFREYLGMVHPDDREKLAEDMLAASGYGQTTAALQWRVQLPDGRTRRLAGSLAPLGAGEDAVRVVGTVRDVTQELMAGLKLALHVSVSEALAIWETPEGGIEGLLRRICMATGWSGGTLFTVHKPTRTLRAYSTWLGAADAGGAYARDIGRTRFRSNEGLPGRVWGSDRAWTMWELLREDPKAAGRRWSPELDGAMAFPVSASGFEAVLEFATGHAGPIDEPLRRTLHAVGLQLGDFLARHRADLGDSPISKREREVLQLAARGGTTASIAAGLVVSPSTVKTHFEKIYGKLGVSDRGEAVAEAFRRGLVQ